jgi:phosphotransferase system HPr (HPr) family protein
MKLRLPDALHARPANLLVRLASRHAVPIALSKGGCRVDARKIIDVLALGAAKGDELELHAEGEGAEAALAELAALIERNFDADLVPEVGSAAAPGIAIGRAIVLLAPTGDARAPHEKGDVTEETRRLHAAVARAIIDVTALVAALPPDEGALFEPERVILEEIEQLAAARVASGESAEDAVRAATEPATTDLLLDARTRLLDSLAGTTDAALALLASEGGDDEVVVVVEVLTPSLVAALPAFVRGIVAAADYPGDAPGDAPQSRGAPGGHTSHAAILARGRELPLAFVPSHVALAIEHGDAMVVDTTEAQARVWVAPSDALVEDARARRTELARVREMDEARAASLAGELGVALYVNIGSLQERIPAGARGVGLLRTELVFAGRATAPGEAEQVAAITTIARAARGGVVTVRLFDAGGDKPLPWLPSNEGDARGIALLRLHPAVLDAQLRAITRASAHANVRALIPMVRSADDVNDVRRRAPGLTLGAMIETPEAARDIEAIAAAADFVCIGTNDLTAQTLGAEGGERLDASRGLDPRVLALVGAIVEGAHARGRTVTVCGELAADVRGACILVGLGVDALSIAPAGFSPVVLTLRDTSVDDCRRAAREALPEARES